MLLPAEKSEILALQSGRGIGGHERAFDEQRARAAHRIDERAAVREHLEPAAADQHRGREIFLERRFALPAPPAAPVQRRAREIERQRRDITVQAQVYADRRRFELDAGPRARAIAELIDDRILDALCDELRVRERALTRHRVDRERRLGVEMQRPVGALHARVERIGIARFELVEFEQDAACETRLETRLVAEREIARERDARKLLVRIARAERRELVAHEVFEALCAGRKIRSRVVGHVSRDP